MRPASLHRARRQRRRHRRNCQNTWPEVSFDSRPRRGRTLPHRRRPAASRHRAHPPYCRGAASGCGPMTGSVRDSTRPRSGRPLVRRSATRPPRALPWLPPAASALSGEIASESNRPSRCRFNTPVRASQTAIAGRSPGPSRPNPTSAPSEDIAGAVLSLSL